MTAGVDSAFECLLMGTIVVTPLATLVKDAFDTALGLIPLDDVPAAADRDVERETREGVSEGGLPGIFTRLKEGEEREDAWVKGIKRSKR